jgi:hypothetical protein
VAPEQFRVVPSVSGGLCDAEIASLADTLRPLVWLLSLPFRLVGIAVEGVFSLLRAMFLLPARILGRAR